MSKYLNTHLLAHVWVPYDLTSEYQTQHMYGCLYTDICSMLLKSKPKIYVIFSQFIPLDNLTT